MNEQSYLMTVWKRFKQSKLALIFSFIFILIVILSIVLPFVLPYGPNEITTSFGGAPSATHWLGTDQIGRDILARVVKGVQISLLVGVSATLISSLIGIVLGLLSGYFGGILDHLLMRFTDMVMSFPYILLVLVAAAVFKPGLISIILILGFVDWPGMVRIVRGNVLALREAEFVKGCQVAGLPWYKILFSELLPNTIAPILIYATNVLAMSMLDEAALSFLGLGVQQPTASLGNILNSANSITVLTEKWWMWVPAGVVLVLLVVSINFIGDALRDAFDPNGKDS